MLARCHAEMLKLRHADMPGSGAGSLALACCSIAMLAHRWAHMCYAHILLCRGACVAHQTGSHVSIKHSLAKAQHLLVSLRCCHCLIRRYMPGRLLIFLWVYSRGPFGEVTPVWMSCFIPESSGASRRTVRTARCGCSLEEDGIMERLIKNTTEQCLM